MAAAMRARLFFYGDLSIFLRSGEASSDFIVLESLSEAKLDVSSELSKGLYAGFVKFKTLGEMADLKSSVSSKRLKLACL